jgi:hypothetical protein
MAKYSVEQRRLVYRGREFHFVLYEGQPANPKREQPATAPTWWLMSEGKRWEVMPQQPDQAEPELDRQLTAWLEEHVFQSPNENGE